MAGSCAKEEAVLVLESAVFAIEEELVLPFLHRNLLFRLAFTSYEFVGLVTVEF